MRSLISSPTRSFPRRSRASRARRVGLERLEGRALLATISVTSASLSEIGEASAFVAPGSGGLDRPRDLTLGPDGNLYVPSANTNSVLRYNAATGALIGTFVAANSGGLVSPFGLAFGPDGNLYVGGAGGSDAIFRYNGTTGTYIDTFVPTGTGGLITPRGIAFGADGNLYVSGGSINSVLRFQGPTRPAPGSPSPAIGQSGATFVAAGAGGLVQPLHLAFGPNGNLFVASTTTNPTVLEFGATDGSLIATTVSPGEGGLGTPSGLAFDQDGRLYVADATTNSIHRYDSQGQYLDDPVGNMATTLSGPVGMVFDAQGALLVSSNTNAIVRCDRGVVVTLSAASPTPVTVNYTTVDGTAAAGADYSAQAGTVTFAPGQTSRRILLATHDDLSVEGNETFTIQLSNATGGATIAGGGASVTIVDEDITRQSSISDASAIEGDHAAHYRGAFVVTPPLLNSGHDVVFNGGYFYMSPGPATYASIDRYDAATGAFIDHFIQAGRIEGVRSPVFRNGFLYVGSSYTHEVLRYDAVTGAPAGVSGLPGDPVFVSAGSGGLNYPSALCFGPDGNLYVSARPTHNVFRYDGTTGQPLGTLDTTGPGSLSLPQGLTIDSGGIVYVASVGSNQIQKYNEATGAYLGSVSSPAMANPTDVKIGPDGLLYVLSSGNNRILRFTIGGSYVDDYVPAGSGGMTSPGRMNFGPDGDLYVSAPTPNVIE